MRVHEITHKSNKTDRHESSVELHIISLLLLFHCHLQTSFWIHQLFIMSVELWRKDFHLFYFHHVITIGMLTCSYFLGLTRVGTAVLVEQVSAWHVYWGDDTRNHVTV